MVTITAVLVKAETGWVDDDISDTNLEYLIDKAINWVNLNAGTSMSNLSGAPGTVTVTADQGPVVKAWIELLVRAYTDKGPQVAVATLSVAEITSDPHYRLMTRMGNVGINRLRGRSFERT